MPSSILCVLVFDVVYTGMLVFDPQVVFCGMMSSSGLWGSICDKYGRKTVSVPQLSEHLYLKNRKNQL